MQAHDAEVLWVRVEPLGLLRHASHGYRGRGAVGSRADEPGPFLPESALEGMPMAAPISVQPVPAYTADILWRSAALAHHTLGACYQMWAQMTSV